MQKVHSLEIIRVSKSLSELQDPITGSYSRQEKSLGLLTTRFVTLLQEAKDGVLDLKVAADLLAVRQKRRIYDITNVLEGIGLIEKRSKNSIQWKGLGPSNVSRDSSDRLTSLKDDLANLRKQEMELDKHRQWVQQSIKNVTEEVSNSRLAFITHEDACNYFKGDTILAIQAPAGTQLEVPVPEIGPAQKVNYQVHLKSQNGPIKVLLVQEQTEESDPVVPNSPTSEAQEKVGASVSTNDSDPSGQHPNVENQKDMGSIATRRKRSLGFLKQPLVITETSRMTTRSSPRKIAMETNSHQGSSCDSTIPNSQSSSASQGVVNNDSVCDMVYIDNPEDVWDLDQLMTSDSFIPLLSLSPPPSGSDYYFNLEDTEGACDLYDVDVPHLLS